MLDSTVTKARLFTRCLSVAFGVLLIAILGLCFCGHWSVASELSPVALVLGIVSAISADLWSAC